MEVAPPAVQENVEVELAAVAGPAAAVREDSGDAEAQLGENIFHDAGTWPRYVPGGCLLASRTKTVPSQPTQRRTGA